MFTLIMGYLAGRSSLDSIYGASDLFELSLDVALGLIFGLMIDVVIASLLIWILN